jgi:hypothetical protein
MPGVKVFFDRVLTLLERDCSEEMFGRKIVPPVTYEADGQYVIDRVVTQTMLFSLGEKIAENMAQDLVGNIIHRERCFW